MNIEQSKIIAMLRDTGYIMRQEILYTVLDVDFDRGVVWLLDDSGDSEEVDVKISDMTIDNTEFYELVKLNPDKY